MADPQTTDMSSVPSTEPMEQDSSQSRQSADSGESISTDPTSAESTKPASDSNPPESTDPTSPDRSIKKESPPTSTSSLPNEKPAQNLGDVAQDDNTVAIRERFPRERSPIAGRGRGRGRGEKPNGDDKGSSQDELDDRYHNDSGRLKLPYRKNTYRPNYRARPVRAGYDDRRDRSPSRREPLPPQREVYRGQRRPRGNFRGREPGHDHPRDDFSWGRREYEYRENRARYAKDWQNRDLYERDSEYTYESQLFSPPRRPSGKRPEYTGSSQPRGPSTEYRPEYIRQAQRSPPRGPAGYRPQYGDSSQRFRSPPRGPSAEYGPEHTRPTPRSPPRGPAGYRPQYGGSSQRAAPPHGPSTNSGPEYTHSYQRPPPRGPSADFPPDYNCSSLGFSPPRGPSREYRSEYTLPSQRHSPQRQPSHNDQHYYYRSDQTRPHDTRARQEADDRDVRQHRLPQQHSPPHTQDLFTYEQPEREGTSGHLSEMARQFRFTREEPDLIPWYEPKPWTRATAIYPPEPEMDYEPTNVSRTETYRRAENHPSSPPQTSSAYPPHDPREFYRPTGNGGRVEALPPRDSPYSPRELSRPTTSQGRMDMSRPPTRSAYPSRETYRPISRSSQLESPHPYSRPPTRDRPPQP